MPKASIYIVKISTFVMINSVSNINDFYHMMNILISALKTLNINNDVASTSNLTKGDSCLRIIKKSKKIYLILGTFELDFLRQRF